MAPRLPDMNPDDLYPRMDLPRTLDQVYQAYIQRKQLEAQQGQLAAQKQRQTAEDQLKYGFPAEAVTQPMEGNPWAAQIEAFNQRRSKMQGFEEQKAQAEIEKLKAQSVPGHEEIGGSPFRTDPETGIMYRIKPGHKGQETIPLPGQAIGPEGKVVFTSGLDKEGKRLPAPDVLKLNEGAAVLRMLPDLRALIKAKKNIFGPAKGRVGAANPYDTEAQVVRSKIKAISQAFGRYMEGGVLRKEDEVKYEQMFPQLSDLDTVGIGKLDNVEKMLAEKFASDKASVGASGYDVSGVKDIETGGKVSAADRYEQLKAGGMSESEIYKKLAAEGY